MNINLSIPWDSMICAGLAVACIVVGCGLADRYKKTAFVLFWVAVGMFSAAMDFFQRQ